MSVNSEAFQRELREAREFNRGSILVATITVRCAVATCPVTTIRIGIREEPGQTKVMQLPLTCPRCREPLLYLGLERGR